MEVTIAIRYRRPEGHSLDKVSPGQLIPNHVTALITCKMKKLAIQSTALTASLFLIEHLLPFVCHLPAAEVTGFGRFRRLL